MERTHPSALHGLDAVAFLELELQDEVGSLDPEMDMWGVALTEHVKSQIAKAQRRDRDWYIGGGPAFAAALAHLKGSLGEQSK